MADSERTPRRRGEPVREKILDTADRLFYRDGARAVGVDTIVAESGVAKMSLYRWFPTKDDLIAAFLERRNDQFWAQWEKVASKACDPRDAIAGQLDWLTRYVMSRDYRGCSFLNTAAAFPDLSHPARAVCAANKQRLYDELRALAGATGVNDADILADQLMLLIEGAFANAPVLGKASPARNLAIAGRALLAAA